jgi:hypothetical protein
MTSCNFDRHARYRAAMTLDRCIAVACVTALSSGCGAPIEDTSGTEPASTTSSSTTTTSETPTSTGDAGTSTGTTAAADTTGEDSGTTEEPPPDPPAAYEEWLKVEVPGTVCGNGSQYKFFVNYKEGAKDLLIMLEPGGACWDFNGCSGKSDLGAAHPDGIPDNLMNDAGQSANISPLIRRTIPGPTNDFNMVFLPYCTGDVHTGNNVIVYQDPDGVEPDLEFHHNGHNNVIAATAWMDHQFQDIDRLFVTGCSAGGAGSIINYYFFRSGLNAQRGYLLDDSGPIFPSTGYSKPLHSMIRSSWDVDSVLTELPPGYEITDDFGKINTHVADLFPEDRLTTVFFQRDYNYSRYSYENFYDDNAKSDIHQYWAADTDLLVDLYQTRENLGYYLPYWRALNDSHCVSIASYIDTDIEELDINLGDYVDELFNDNVPVGRYRESVQPGEDD